MSQSRHSRIRRWHTRRVFTPLSIRVEGAGSGSYFLKKLEARWSVSRRTWLWRLPAAERKIGSESIA